MPDDPRTDNLHDLFDAMERDATRDLIRFCVGVTVGVAIGAAMFMLGQALA